MSGQPEAAVGIGGFCNLCGSTNPDDLGKVIGICLDATACHQRQYARLRDRADAAMARAEAAEAKLAAIEAHCRTNPHLAGAAIPQLAADILDIITGTGQPPDTPRPA